MTVKRLKPSETEEISILVSGALRRDFPYKKNTINFYLNYFNPEYFLKLIKSEKGFILGAFEENKLVGIAAIKPDFGGVAYIDWLVVEEASRGKGVGSMLLSKIDKWALANKFHYLYLYTETEKNIKYYERRGYKYIGVYRSSWFGEDEHTLGKLLREKPFPEIFE